MSKCKYRDPHRIDAPASGGILIKATMTVKLVEVGKHHAYLEVVGNNAGPVHMVPGDTLSVTVTK